MINQSIHTVRPATRTGSLRGWRGAVGLSAAAGGAVMVTGAFLPWVSTFAGLIGISGVRGANGRILAAAGAVIAVTGLYHAVRGGKWSRWLMGFGGFAATAFSGYLLLRLAASLQVLSGDSMVAARGGPGLWVTAAGSALAFGTLFLPSSSQGTLVRRDSSDGLLAWAGDRESAGPRRGLQVAIGLVWLAVAALQFQPFMFTRGFVNQILSPAAMGSPAPVTGPIMAFGRLILAHPVAWNAAFAIIQLALGAAILWRRTARAGLAASIAWALAVWWFGESLGGILSGSASPLTGAPGAALLYALVALLAWPGLAWPGLAWPGLAWPGRRDDRRTGSVAAASLLGARGARLMWLALWASFAYLVLRAVNRAPSAVHDTISSLAAGEPRWIAALDRGAAGAAGTHGYAISIMLAAVFLAVAVGVFLPSTTRPALVLGVIAALAIWVIGENFGGILTGRATDPSTGPLLILVAAAFWPLRTGQPPDPVQPAAPAISRPVPQLRPAKKG